MRTNHTGMPHRISATARTVAAYALPLLVLQWAACATARAAPPICAGTFWGNGTIAAIGQDGTLVLTDSRRVRLSGVQDGDVAAVRPHLLERLRGKTIAMYGYSPIKDRYGRLRAQVAVGAEQVWLQRDLIQQGIVRAQFMPDRYECAAELLADEDGARHAHTGHWGDGAFAVRTPDTVGAFVGTFQIIEGRILGAERKDGRVFLNFGADWKTDFTVTLSPPDAKAFRHRAYDPLRLLGSRVRVRGTVQSYRGPEIELYGPESLETLE